MAGKSIRSRFITAVWEYCGNDMLNRHEIRVVRMILAAIEDGNIDYAEVLSRRFQKTKKIWERMEKIK